MTTSPGLHRQPTQRHRLAGPATTVLAIPLPSFSRVPDVARVWWLRLVLAIPRTRRTPRRWVLALGAMLVPVFLVACGGPSSGVVVRKQDIAAYTSYTTDCAMRNTKGQCTVYVNTPHHHAEEWQLFIRNDKNDEGWVDVTRDEYDRAVQGMHWSEKDGLTP